jgi:cell division protein FtsB
MITKEFKNRRYYLHAKIKPHVKFDVYARTITATEDEISKLPANIKAAIDELCNRFHYVIQIQFV